MYPALIGLWQQWKRRCLTETRRSDKKMTILRNLVCRIGLMMAVTVSVPFGYAAPPSTGMSADEAITEAADGMALYQAHCAACHNGQVPRAPHMITFSNMGADTLLNAMNDGVMRAQASALSATERGIVLVSDGFRLVDFAC